METSFTTNLNFILPGWAGVENVVLISNLHACSLKGIQIIIDQTNNDRGTF